jgi:hypothetical protein
MSTTYDEAETNATIDAIEQARLEHEHMAETDEKNDLKFDRVCELMDKWRRENPE